MLGSSVLTLFFAAGVLALPTPQDVHVTTVTETDYYDTQGHLINKKYDVSKPQVNQAPKAPVVPQAPAQPQPQPQNNAPAKQVPYSGGGSTNKQPSAAVSQIQSNADEQVAKTTNRWVDPTDPIFKAIAVWHHNIHRTNHSTDNVVYDDQLAQAAQQWAESCQTEEKIPEGSGYGMNVAFSGEDANYNPSKWISGGWYNDELENIPAYGNPNLDVNNNFNNWGHATQLLWPDSKKIGCGVARCPGSGWAIHAGCMYYPAGNIIGSFDKVKKPTGQPVVLPNGQSH